MAVKPSPTQELAALINSGSLVQARNRGRVLCQAAPGDAGLWCVLAVINGRLGDPVEAAACASKAVTLAPQDAQCHFLFGQTQEARGDWQSAEVSYREAIRLRQDFLAARNALGGALEKLSRPAEAVAAYQDALAQNPNEPAVLNNLGNALRTQGRFTEAEKVYRAGLAVAPDHADILANLGALLTAQARYDEAEASLGRALALRPDFAKAHGNLVFWMNYNPARTAAEMYAAHVAWAERFAPVIPRGPHRNAREPDRPLRLGYVSPDFRRHAVAYFLEPVLRSHDRAQFEVYCYAEVPAGDEVTERFRSYAPVWRRTCGMTDAELAAQIEADGIDILVDLAGHTRGNRLAVFARKPAPVEVNYLGYCNTSGLSTMDWRITDRVADPEGAQAFYTEKLRYLDPCFFCYEPTASVPPVAPLPALTAGTVTFGSLANPAKLNRTVLELWARVLHAVPGSRLLIARRSHKGEVRARFLRAFEALGLGPDRVEIFHAIPVGPNHFNLYHRMDISLDTFPWSGHTTSCEAMLMGVPTVTLTGDRHASRMVASLLHGVGLSQLIAATADEFVAIAQRLAADIPALAELRAGLRARLLTGPVCDAVGYTRRLEAAYRDMWREWCALPVAR